ncbi:hypothetical protein AX14_008146 [Amanita brunnescens Koide BX004]|jgi:hypothetical protein|nr:hypothetical protein AX14_008146 [Amanita brunnescens Koide BX004]
MKPEFIISMLRKMSTDVTTTSNVSLSDFSHAVEKLDAAGSNWVLFQSRFLIAVEQKEVLEHFDGTSKKPALGGESPSDAELKTYKKDLAAWQKKEFSHKSMHMQSNLHTEFRVKYETLLNVRIKISDNDYRSLIINFLPPELSSFLSQMSVNMKHMMSSLVKSKLISLPAELKGKIPTLIIDPEDLMQAALEEWERREADKKS